MTKKKSLLITIFVYSIAIVSGYIAYRYFVNDMSILYATLLANMIATTIIFIASITYNNSSLYDPYWSVIPVFIVLLWIVEFQTYTSTSWLMFFGVFLWGLRLTVNWITDFKGYSFEDFRYVEFRKRFPKLYWLVSYTGVHMFPTFIVYASLFPIYYVLRNGASDILYVYIGVIIMVVGTIISYIADTQLRVHKSQKTGTSITTGLWKYSRHPNYFGELTFWFGVAICSVSVGIYFVPFVGFIGMVLLFNLYSVPKMEQKLLYNKPDYQFVLDTIPRFFINPFRTNEVEEQEGI